MINKKLEADASFQVLSHAFSVSPSVNDYTLQYSADGIEWSDYAETVVANEVLIVTDCAYGQFIKLNGYQPTGDYGTLIY